MANIKFTNFARSTLAIGAASGATSLTVASGTGVKFPVITGAEYFYVTLENAALVREIVKVTARTTDTFTVVRAQDNTTAQTWNAGDVAALRFNAKAIEESVAGAVLATTATGSAILPKGTTAQRDGTPVKGYLRYNETTDSFEGYAGATPAWGAIGGGGSLLGGAVATNLNTLTASVSIPAGSNGSATGPLTIPVGMTITVASGSRFVLL